MHNPAIHLFLFLLRAAYKPKNFRANSAKYGANGSAHGARGSDNFDQLLV